MRCAWERATVIAANQSARARYAVDHNTHSSSDPIRSIPFHVCERNGTRMHGSRAFTWSSANSFQPSSVVNHGCEMLPAGVPTRHRVVELAGRAEGRGASTHAAAGVYGGNAQSDRAAALIAEIGAEIFDELEQNRSAADPSESSAEECPVCFEALTARAELPCGHALCAPCLRTCWDVEQRSPATWKSRTLTCPLCRDSRPLAPRLEAIFLAEGPRDGREETEAPAEGQMHGIDSLSALELRVISGMLGIHHNHAASADVEERHEQEAAISEYLIAQTHGVREPAPPSAVAKMEMLPAKCLKTILLLRDIPFDDCLEKSEFVQRVLDTPRGGCIDR